MLIKHEIQIPNGRNRFSMRVDLQAISNQKWIAPFQATFTSSAMLQTLRRGHIDLFMPGSSAGIRCAYPHFAIEAPKTMAFLDRVGKTGAGGPLKCLI